MASRNSFDALQKRKVYFGERNALGIPNPCVSRKNHPFTHNIKRVFAAMRNLLPGSMSEGVFVGRNHGDIGKTIFAVPLLDERDGIINFVLISRPHVARISARVLYSQTI
ncbi:MAG: hypothetical protein FWC42_02450 [Proteobacteria bacterium]|nr:hypothetical protein [Pseudomonadota bacterium]MCL2309124.1 hypothetical protein [Pseudomonadota bacterium]